MPRTNVARSSIVFGPIADPQGFYGIGVYKVEDEEEIRRLSFSATRRTGHLKYEITRTADAVVGPEVGYPNLG